MIRSPLLVLQLQSLRQASPGGRRILLAELPRHVVHAYPVDVRVRVDPFDEALKHEQDVRPPVSKCISERKETRYGKGGKERSYSPANVGVYSDREDEVLFLAVEVCEGVLPNLLDVARVHLRSPVSASPSRGHREHGSAYPSV